VLLVYFEELRKYEDQPNYYRRKPADRNFIDNINIRKFEADSQPLQLLRTVVSKVI